MKVKIYSTPTCPYCQMAKKYLHEKKIEYEDFDVSLNREKAEEMVKISGQMGVPVIVIGSQIIIGFDREQIENALKA